MTTTEPLDVVAARVRATATRGSQRVATAAMSLKALKARVDDGDPGAEGLPWPAFSDIHFADLGPDRVDELLAAADAPDPAAALRPSPDPDPADAELPLPELAGRVNVLLTRSDSARVAAGRLLLAAKRRVAAGEAGEGTTWRAWVKGHIDRSHRDANKIVALARADDPEAAAERERERNRAAVRRHRERRKSYVSPTPAGDADPATAAVAEVEALAGDRDGPAAEPVEALAAAYAALGEAERKAVLDRIGAAPTAESGPRADDAPEMSLDALRRYAKRRDASGPDAPRWALIAWACGADPDRVREVAHEL